MMRKEGKATACRLVCVCGKGNWYSPKSGVYVTAVYQTLLKPLCLHHIIESSSMRRKAMFEKRRQFLRINGIDHLLIMALLEGAGIIM